jgi:hypothetical protein
MGRYDNNPFPKKLPGPQKYTLMWIPSTGLMYDGGEFFDGQMKPIRWDRTIHIFQSHAKAETAKKKILEKYPDAQGELVVLPVKVHLIGEEEPDEPN